MDSVLLLLTLLAVVKTVLSDSLLPRRWQGLSFGLLCAASVWLSHPWALELNKLQVENALSEQKALMNISLAVMLDLLLTFGTCWARIVSLRKTRWLRYVPSLLIFPALFYLQVNLFFSFAGSSFTTVSLLLAAATLFAAGWEKPRLTRRYWAAAGLLLILAVTAAFQVRGDYLASWGAGVWALNSAAAGFRRAFEGKQRTGFSRALSFAEGTLLAATGILFFFRFDRAFFETAPFYTLFFYADAMIRLASTPWRKAHK